MKKLFTIFLAVPLLFAVLPVQTNAESNINDEIIYDILVDRFNNGSQAPSDQVDVDDPLAYNGGDIKGVTMKLDSLVEHGFTAVSLSPVMENAKGGYHGYWIEEFFSIEEEFGSMEDLEELIEEAHERDIKVILELVTNYVSKTSPLVEDPEKADWFLENETEPIEATEWLDEVLVFDQENKDVQDYLLDVAAYWMDETDIDGFKLHAADQASSAFLQKLTDEIKTKDSNFYLIATTLQGNDDMEHVREIEQIDAIANDAMYEAMNEVFIKPDEPISKLYDVRGEEASNRDLLYVDNWNTPRFSNNFAEQGRNAETTWGLALGYLYLTPGVPIIYQGSEVPMYGPGYPENQYIVDFTSANPDLKKVFERMSALRKQFPSLSQGDLVQLENSEGFSLFKRTLDDEAIYVAINNDSESRTATITEVEGDKQLRGLLHDDTVRANEDGEYLIGVARESVEVYTIEQNIGINWGFIAFVIGVFVVFIGAVIRLSIKQRKREMQ